MSHLSHSFANVMVDLDNKKKLLEASIMDIEDKYCETNFKLIEEFKKSFESDYDNEKKRIQNQYKEIRRKIDELEQHELDNLERSKEAFLESKFRKVFNESDRVSNYYKIFYDIKDQCKMLLNLDFSHYNRFKFSLNNKEVNLTHYRNFNKRFEKFYEYSEILKTNAEKLIEKCTQLRIPGKYIFRQESYTDEIQKFVKTMESKVRTERHKYFDYSGNDSLFLSRELLMIIPLTNCVFSYVKNTYKKIQVNFDDNDVKIKSFLPGCATLHLGDNFFLTGGELKDEGSSTFMFMNIDDKIMDESVEMNFNRRYHTMVSIMNRYICVIGGWNCAEFEIIDTNMLDYWKLLPPMSHVRSDPTVYFFNQQYVYVFGGWNYSKKTCVAEIERYQLFDSEMGLKFGHWEPVKIKNNNVFLQKYNMGLIPLIEESSEASEKLILIGGFDEEYDYTSSIVKLEIMKKDASVYVNKDIKGLPTDGECSFWYEKTFHLMFNEKENETTAVNFNCFNNIYVYSLKKNEFRMYTNNVVNK